MKDQLVPELRFSEFEGEWERRTLNHFLSVIKTKNKDGKFKRNQVLSVAAEAGVVNQIEYHGRSYAGKSLLPYNVVEVGDLVYTKSPLKAYPYGIVKKNSTKAGVVSTLYAVYRPKSTVSATFVDYYFYLPSNANRYLKPLVNIGAKNDMKVNNATVLTGKVVYPTLPEQQKIASFLTLVDRRLAAARRRVKLLEEWKMGVMQRLFSIDDTSSWQSSFLSAILTERKERNTDGKVKDVFSVAKHAGIINQIEHLGRSYASDNTTNYKVVYPGDVIYTKSPTSEFPFGIIKQNQTGRIGIVSVLYAVYQPASYEVGTLLHNYFSSPVKTYNYLVPIVRKGAKNTMNVNNKEFLRSLKVPLPTDNKTTEETASIFTTIDTRITAAQKEVTGWENWKRGLLQKLLV
jgi:type I restriction enzyme S subunit